MELYNNEPTDVMASTDDRGPGRQAKEDEQFEAEYKSFRQEQVKKDAEAVKTLTGHTITDAEYKTDGVVLTFDDGRVVQFYALHFVPPESKHTS